MKIKDVVKGGVYLAKVSGRLVRVRVNDFTEQWCSYANKGQGAFKWRGTATNLATGRRITLMSAQRLRPLPVSAPLAALRQYAAKAIERGESPIVEVLPGETEAPIGPNTFVLDRHTRGMGYVDLVLDVGAHSSPDLVTVYDRQTGERYPAARSALKPAGMFRPHDGVNVVRILDVTPSHQVDGYFLHDKAEIVEQPCPMCKTSA